MGLRAEDCECPTWPFSHREECPAILRRQLWKMYRRMFPDENKDIPEPLLRAAAEEVHEVLVIADIEHCKKRGTPVNVLGYADGTQYDGTVEMRNQ